MNITYHETILNPIADNIARCQNPTDQYYQDRNMAKALYNYLTAGKVTVGNTVVESPYNGDYSYADESWAGDISATTLQNIMTSITQEIIKNYTTVTTTENVPVNDETKLYELVKLDVNHNIVIKVDDNDEINKSFDELVEMGIASEGANGEKYINLQVLVNDDTESITITYYEQEPETSPSSPIVLNTPDRNIKGQVLKTALDVIDNGNGEELIAKVEEDIKEEALEAEPEVEDEIVENIETEEITESSEETETIVEETVVEEDEENTENEEIIEEVINEDENVEEIEELIVQSEEITEPVINESELVLVEENQ